MRVFVELLKTFVDLHDLCVQMGSIFFDPSDRCMLPFHMFQLFLKLWQS